MKFNQACVLSLASLLLLSTHSLKAQDATLTPAQAAHQEARISAKSSLLPPIRRSPTGSDSWPAVTLTRLPVVFNLLSTISRRAAVSAGSYHRAEVGMAQAKEGQAEALAKDNKYAQANTLLQQAIVLDPNNPNLPVDIENLKQEQMAYEAQSARSRRHYVNPAVTDDFKARVATVQKLLFQGDAFFRTGAVRKGGGKLLQNPHSRSLQ